MLARYHGGMTPDPTDLKSKSDDALRPELTELERMQLTAGLNLNGHRKPQSGSGTKALAILAALIFFGVLAYGGDAVRAGLILLGQLEAASGP